MLNKKVKFLSILVIIIGLAVTMASCDMGNGVVDEIEDEPLKITNIEEISDKTVEYGTVFEDIDLPEDVVVTLDDNTTTNLDVNWLEGDYDEKIAAAYTIVGELELTDEIINPDDLYPSVQVTVQEEGIILYTVSVDYDDDKGTVAGDGVYEEGEEVELTATAKEGYVFKEWTGHVESTDNTITFDMPAEDVELTAAFEEKEVKSEEYLLEIDKSPDDGFHWTYYLYIPEGVNFNKPTRLLVESNNPKRSDDRSVHKANAREIAKYNHYAHSLYIPVLVPAFPRFENAPPNYEEVSYISLCERALAEDYEEAKRLDKQVLEMIDYAQAFLKNHADSNLSELEFKEKIFLNGDSASAAFANRFTKLHPERVRAVATGAQDHIIFPFDRLHGETFNYPAGINDLNNYTDEDFDLDAYREVAKFYTAGALEGTLNEFAGRIREPAQREAIREAFGTGIDTRWDNAESEYDKYNIPVQMVIYNATSHEIRDEMLEDRVEFFRANLGEELVMDIDTHQYAEDDFVEDFKRFDKVNIKDIHWSQDPELPPEHQEFWQYDGGDPDQIIFVTEEGFSSETQFVDFIFRTGLSFELIPDDRNIDKIELTKKDLDQGVYRIIDMVDGAEKFYGISLHLSYNEADYNHSAKYEVEIDSEVEEYFEVPDDLYLEPIE